MSVTVRSLLTSLAQEGVSVQYVIPPGNAGDSLISAGFFQLAQDIGLRYSAVEEPVTAGTEVVIFGGGGGLAGGWSTRISDLVTRQADTGARVILMPVSIQGKEEFLKGLKGNVTLFAREKQSFEHARRHATGGCSVLLDHDTALHLDARSFLGDSCPKSGFPARNPKEIVRHLMYRRAYCVAGFQNPIYAFRTDREANPKIKVRRSVWRDLSVIASFGTQTQQQCLYTSWKFLALLDRYEHVHTDRLHVGVGAAMLGKRVRLYDNSYFKVRAIFEMSLQEYDVEMVDVA